jgi:hypothetical protein
VADFPLDLGYRSDLAQSYLDLARLLWEVGLPPESPKP